MSSEADARDAADEIGVLVLALGNVLLADDGLGPAAVARLERDYRIPPGVRLEDGGTLGLSLLGLVADARHVILVDAVRTDAAAGELVRIDGSDVADAVRDRLSPHQVGVADLLEAARLIGRSPRTVTLLGLVPDSLELGIVRTKAVDEGIDVLVDAIIEEVRQLGYAIERDGQNTARPRPVHNLARHFGM